VVYNSPSLKERWPPSPALTHGPELVGCRNSYVDAPSATVPNSMKPSKAIASLIKENGTPFSASEIGELIKQLEVLTTEQRIAFRNSNATAIAEHSAPKMLIVSGRGTGKSHLFLDKIRAWLNSHADKTILVTSFVRKLVADLKTDVENKLAVEHSPEVTVWTLHKLARSIVERNHGCSRRRFRPHLKIMAGLWQVVVWLDTLHFHPALNHSTYKWKDLEKQFHNDSYSDESAWKVLRDTYFVLSQFYNAAGFADLIIAAREALEDDETLVRDELFIVDEYQDFNEAEERLLMHLTRAATNILLVGDDDQVLYETLKSGKAGLIRRLYTDPTIVNAMLPFCGRSDFHIVKTAHHFISDHRDKDSIEKIYLPLDGNVNASRVQFVGCTTPATAVDPSGFIGAILRENKNTVVTWGFNPEHQPSVSAVGEFRKLGFKLIWFDGNRPAALREFIKRGTVPEVCFYLQMYRIETTKVVETMKPVIIDPFDAQGDFKSAGELLEEIRRA
jgi:hypothetical protein